MISLSSLLLYFGLPFGGLGALAAALVFLTPWGPAILNLFASSKVARIAAGVGAAALAVGLACLKAFNAGKASERSHVVEANAAAVTERRKIEADVSRESDDALRAELKGWSQK